jgi:hypothetical protein
MLSIFFYRLDAATVRQIELDLFDRHSEANMNPA